MSLIDRIFGRKPAVDQPVEMKEVKAVEPKDKKVSEVAANAVPAAVAKVDDLDKPVVNKSLSEKVYLGATVIAGVVGVILIIIAAIYSGVSVAAITSGYAIAGYALLGVAALSTLGYYFLSDKIKNAYNQYRKGKEEKAELNNKQKIEAEREDATRVNAYNLYKAVKDFDNLKRKSNLWSTAKGNFDSATKAMIKEASDYFKKNRENKTAEAMKKEFAQEMAKASDSGYRVNLLDGRYGLPKEEDDSGVIYETFVEKLVEVEMKKTQAKYSEELKQGAKSIAEEYKKANLENSGKIVHKIRVNANELFKNEKYEILGKNYLSIIQELTSEIRKLVGDKYINNEMNNIDKLVANGSRYYSDVSRQQGIVKKDYDKQVANIEKKLAANSVAMLKNLKEELDLDKVKHSQLEIVRNKNNTKDRIEQAYKTIADIDKRREEIKAEKERLKQERENLLKQKQEKINNLPKEYITQLDARKKAFGYLIGKENLEDLKLPEVKKQSSWSWKKRAAIGIPLLAAAGAGAYGYVYGIPEVASNAVGAVYNRLYPPPPQGLFGLGYLGL